MDCTLLRHSHQARFATLFRAFGLLEPTSDIDVLGKLRHPTVELPSFGIHGIVLLSLGSLACINLEA